MLLTLLSRAFVAYTIEFDNEFEHRLPHRTTDGGGDRADPWLVSAAMWWNGVRHLRDGPLTVAELTRAARTTTNLAGLRRWGYLAIEPGSAGGDPKRPGPAAVLRLRAGGRRADAVWRDLPDVVDARWRERFGAAPVDGLRDRLAALERDFDLDRPDTLPIVGYGQFTGDRRAGEEPSADFRREHRPPGGAAGPPVPLPALLARVLTAFALEFEREPSAVSLAVAANLLPRLGGGGARRRDLPAATGLAPGAVAVGVGWLERHGFAVIEPDGPTGRDRRVRLLGPGTRAAAGSAAHVDTVQQRWRARYGTATIDDLVGALTAVVGGAEPSAALAAGLTPYPDGWRAGRRPPATLPRFPLVTHRGGFPDGA